jgi:hypothetical protein
MNISNTKQERVLHANQLIAAISRHGRRFFYSSSKGRTASMEIDSRGKVWFIDDYTGKRIYTHYERHWRGFSHGGTLKDLVKLMRDYIRTGERINIDFIAPNRGILDGSHDMWGYGDEACLACKNEARKLEIIKEFQ